MIRVGEGLLALGKIALVVAIGFPLFMYTATRLSNGATRIRPATGRSAASCTASAR